MKSSCLPVVMRLLAMASFGVAILFISTAALSQVFLPGTEPVELEEQLNIPLNNGIQEEGREEADLLLRLGGQAQRQGSFEKAIAYWQQALDLYQRLGDFEGQGLAYDYLGLTYANLGRYPQAEDALRRRLGVARYLKDFQGQIFALNNLGTLLLQAGNLEAAQVSFAEALDIARTVKNPEGEGLSLSNLGLVAAQAGNYLEAVKRYEASLAFRRRLGDPLGEANTRNNLGDAYQALNQHQDALTSYGLALHVAEDSLDIPNQFRALRGLIRSYSVVGPKLVALKYLKQHLALAQKEQNPREELISLRLYAELYKAGGDLSNARIFYERAILLANSLGQTQEEAFLRNDLAQILYDRGSR
ncbi:MAG TPA: Tfp pilus assembly protein PilF [Cyanobacteria bacterium UBA8803]|nr:Tfp pilus assembly protein PilF [Cyanobacteria bacterium UBA9273]HBL58789.1 Tfp pilus assembly protein PilF [Cyanobacteria bacterium UBA8803]